MAMLLVFALLLSNIGFAAGAQVEKTYPAENTVTAAQGQVTLLENGQVLLTGGEQEIILNITKDTAVLDTVSLDPVSAQNIKDGALVYAYVSLAMTRSQPPQTNAYIVLVNIPADYRVPGYAEIVDKITSGDPVKDGERILKGEAKKLNGTQVQLTTEEGVYVVNVSEETVIRNAVTMERLSLDDIKDGEVLYVATGEIQTASEPPQVSAVAIATNIQKGFVMDVDVFLKQDDATAEETPIFIEGTATKLKSGRLRLNGENAAYMLNILKTTKIYDAASRQEITFADIKDGGTVFAYVSEKMTKSLPPQTSAYVLFANVPHGFEPPAYADVDKWTTESPQSAATLLEGTATKLKSGRVKIITEESGAYMLNISEDTIIFDATAQKEVSLADVKDGSHAYAYVSNAMTFSLPPQTQAYVLIANIPEGYVVPEYETFIEEDVPKSEAKTVCVWGTITEKNGERITLENAREDDPLSPIILTVSASTAIVEAVEGFGRSLDDLEVGDMVIAYIPPYMTLSLPPQAGADLIICDIPQDFAVPTYYEIESVVSTMEATPSSITLVTDRGDNVVVGMDCEIVTYMTDKIATIADLQEGRRILVWNDNKNNPYRVMVFD